ncbi:MAG: sigma-54-dependent Fis family transcriptional regulator, partial [Gammaproteobacteria bacterium]|nr:sigma-54-dependent Fis family transcriptional regulator [Gammaproteobacteria bacterium]
IEQRSMRPVGANHEVQLDVRLITATNRNLEADVESGRFRQDLYYRLSVLGVRMPSLRERRDDIPALVHYFVEKLTEDLRCPPLGIDEKGIERLTSYDWPGNVRELKNVIE